MFDEQPRVDGQPRIFMLALAGVVAVALILVFALDFRPKEATVPSSATASTAVSQPEFLSNRVACISKDLFDQAISAVSQHDQKGFDYLMGRGCIIPKTGTEVSVLDSGFGWLRVRAYASTGDAVELWTTREAIKGYQP